MPVCQNCGAKNRRENTVCRSCGAVLVEDVAAAEPAVRREEPSPAEQPDVTPSREEPSPAPPARAEAELTSEQIGRGALYGLGAALLFGTIWYLIEHFGGWPLSFLAFAAGWLIAMATVFGAGRRQGRQLQWISVGLTLVTILAVQFVLREGWSNPAFLSDFWNALQGDLFTVMFYLLSLWVAYTTPAPRRRPQQQQPTGEGAASGERGTGERAGEQVAVEESGLTCASCKGRTTEEEAYIIPGRRGDIAVCPKCVGEIEERFAAEQRDPKIDQAVLWGVGATLACGVIWFLAEYYSGWPLAFLAFVGGWVIAAAVRRGSGNKRGRTLQLIAVGLTLALILGSQVALAVTRINPVDDGHPTWSPDGKTIAFESLRGGYPAIYTIDVETGAAGRLAQDTLSETTPVWSPAGGRIAFTSDREGNSEIYLMNADGSNITRLTRDPAADTSPTWSPDGQLIAFASGRAGNVDIYVMPLDGKWTQQLTDDPGFDGAPSWSPDGKRIAFASDRAGTMDLYLMDAADGGNVVPLVASPAVDDAPAWSPDGQRIAFQSDRAGSNGIWLVNADGSGIVTVTTGLANDALPAWRSDNTYIAFQSDRDGNGEIYAIRTDRTGEARLTNDATNLGQALVGRVSDLFTPLLFLLGLWQAYSTLAPRRLPKPRAKVAAQA